ncbi:MAG: hypothetical protein KGI78_01015 [Patescibacteria group bacterium]|nr:hypothetical protein [Patescibacteria group bacterium]MDE1943899.1 hypothetical protein [Patescibacteria group bacterium]MDE1945272.1 hypothetical protein [Patescibacteria group bacterium]MDE2057416.1 hypothetical protein [Patescibacteria group bacterium]
MIELTLLLVALQALGALIGVAYALRGELAYVAAMHDGHIDRAERRHLDHLASGLWYGMTLVVAASLGLVLVSYATGAPVQPAETSSYWSFIALVLLVTLATWAISRERLSFSFGSAAVFTGWWFLAYLALGRLPAFSVGAAAALYAVATIVFWGLLHYLRMVMSPPRAHQGGAV